MLAARSDVESRDGLLCRTGLLEKKRGEKTASRGLLTPAAVSGAVADAGISNLLGGEAPVRGFFTGAEDMLISALSERDSLFPVL